MKLTIKKGYRSRNMFQGLVKGRYNMLEFIEGEDIYKFTFTDTHIPRVVVICLQRNGQWNDTERVWTYKFLDSPRSITADWFADSDNACWVLYKLLEEKP